MSASPPPPPLRLLFLMSLWSEVIQVVVGCCDLTVQQEGDWLAVRMQDPGADVSAPLVHQAKHLFSPNTRVYMYKI